MKKLRILPIIALAVNPAYAQETVSEVRTPHEHGKVAVWNEKQDLSGFTFMGQLPVLWEDSSIGKPKMTCALMGGNMLYRKTDGVYEAYSNHVIDLTLIQKILAEKNKFKVLEKLSIEKGPQGYLTQKQDSWAVPENARVQGNRVLIDGKIPGEPVKSFVVTRANSTQWILKTYEEKRLINYIIQVN
jgi:hypothetical protein